MPGIHSANNNNPQLMEPPFLGCKKNVKNMQPKQYVRRYVQWEKQKACVGITCVAKAVRVRVGIIEKLTL